LLRHARPEDATCNIEILDEFLRIIGAFEAFLNNVKLSQRVDCGECSIRHVPNYQHLKRLIGHLTLPTWSRHCRNNHTVGVGFLERSKAAGRGAGQAAVLAPALSKPALPFD
jgi:hypothetical protein